ncbi:hypothetical protein [Paenibacillus dokdonensis]|nr:hypothetical protein [Paenibacillus dokdonensis]
MNLSFGSDEYSVGIALGIFKLIVGLLIVIPVNFIAKKSSSIR